VKESDDVKDTQDTTHGADRPSAAPEVVSVGGELDLATAPDLRSRLEEAIDRCQTSLVVDLLDVTFIDSTALGVLIAVQKECESRGIALRLVIAEQRIIKVFEITGLQDVFSIHPTVGDAFGGDPS
jgi:anti-sigma B factor antagonist